MDSSSCQYSIYADLCGSSLEKNTSNYSWCYLCGLGCVRCHVFLLKILTKLVKKQMPESSIMMQRNAPSWRPLLSKVAELLVNIVGFATNCHLAFKMQQMCVKSHRISFDMSQNHVRLELRSRPRCGGANDPVQTLPSPIQTGERPLPANAVGVIYWSGSRR